MDGARKHPHTLLKALCFVMIGIILLSLLTLLMEPNRQDVQLRKSFYAERKNSLDAVYIGGSVCFMSWVPYVAWDACGFTSYSLGLSRLDSFYVLPMVREVLAYQSPDVLLLDLRPFQYAGEKTKKKETGLELSSTLPLYAPNRYEVALKAYQFADNVEKADTIDSFLFDLIRYHGRWRDINQDSFTWLIKGQKASETKGYRFKPGLKTLSLSDLTSVSDMLAVDKQAETDLINLLTYLQARGQKAMFLVTSYQESAKERSQYNYLASVIQSYGFDYLNLNDFNGQMRMDPEHDYYDIRHLNIFGAEKYSKYVATYVAAKYHLADHRNDAAFSAWAQGYVQWEGLAAQMKEEIDNLTSDSEMDLEDE